MLSSKELTSFSTVCPFDFLIPWRGGPPINFLDALEGFMKFIIEFIIEGNMESNIWSARALIIAFTIFFL